LVFLGTPEPAVVALRALVNAGHDVRMVITRDDKRRGRNEAPSATPVGTAAMELGLPVSHRVEDATAVDADLGVVVAFGRIIKPDVLDRLSLVNVHFSLLPRWRGAAPVERAILAGDTSTGVCLMALDEGLDTGDTYRCQEVAIEPAETAASLTARLAQLGAGLLVRALAEGLGQAEPQRGEPSYAAKIESEDLHLEWTRPWWELHRVVRIGRAWTTWRGQRLLILDAEPFPGARGVPGALDDDVVIAGEGGLRLIAVQPQGRRPMAARDWLHGTRPEPGEVLGG
jgi:methionyl-tRNA formyltransferase